MPAIEVAFAAGLTGLVLGGAGAALAGSPARSTRVLRFSVPGGGGSIVGGLALVAEADISPIFLGEGIRLG